MKKIPMRRCVVTNQSYPKKDLIRVVRTPENSVVVDPSGKVNGHGAYICKSMDAIELAKNKKILEKFLEIKIEDSVYEELAKLV